MVPRLMNFETGLCDEEAALGGPMTLAAMAQVAATSADSVAPMLVAATVSPQLSSPSTLKNVVGGGNAIQGHGGQSAVLLVATKPMEAQTDQPSLDTTSFPSTLPSSSSTPSLPSSSAATAATIVHFNGNHSGTSSINHETESPTSLPVISTLGDSNSTLFTLHNTLANAQPNQVLNGLQDIDGTLTPTAASHAADCSQTPLSHSFTSPVAPGPLMSSSSPLSPLHSHARKRSLEAEEGETGLALITHDGNGGTLNGKDIDSVQLPHPHPQHHHHQESFQSHGQQSSLIVVDTASAASEGSIDPLVQAGRKSTGESGLEWENRQHEKQYQHHHSHQQQYQQQQHQQYQQQQQHHHHQQQRQPQPTPTPIMPARKKQKQESSSAAAKHAENDTASLFNKIFADRDPGKRKIRLKSVHEIPMDLGIDEDDSDFEEPARGINGGDDDDGDNDDDDDDEDMIMPEDAVSEDESKARTEYGNEQELVSTLWQWKDNDPEVCCICLGRYTEADNVFVYCDTLECALCVHQACYGVKNLPSEQEPWMCDRCTAPPEEVVSCVCCPSKDGAFRRLISEDPSKGWIHIVCALWLPETTLGDPEAMSMISVRDIPERNWNMTCYMCSDPQDAALGACVQCDAGQCRKSFHVTCAQAYSLLETVEDSDMADPYFMYCKQHGSANGESRLNGWAKWVKQRDGLLRQWQEEQGRQRSKRLLEMQATGSEDLEGGLGLIEFFEHSYSRFKQARERRIAKERSELSRQYSIGYYLGNKIDKSRTRLDTLTAKSEQAHREKDRIERYTQNLLSSLLECAVYLETHTSTNNLEGPLSSDTTLEWYNTLPDSSRWKGNIQGIIRTIDVESLTCDHPYANSIGLLGQVDSGLEDSSGGERHGRAKGKLGRGQKSHLNGNSTGQHKASKSKKLQPKPSPALPREPLTIVTSSRGRPIKKDYHGFDDSNTLERHQHVRVASPQLPARMNEPCTICQQLQLPEEKLAIERATSNGSLSQLAIKVLNKMVRCDTCLRQYHPKCLDPPMARVPPRGYSWNCEECDSSESGESNPGSPRGASLDASGRGDHQMDIDEALMFLADTAMSVSANNTPVHSSRPTLPSSSPSEVAATCLKMSDSKPRKILPAFGDSVKHAGKATTVSIKPKNKSVIGGAKAKDHSREISKIKKETPSMSGFEMYTAKGTSGKGVKQGAKTLGAAKAKKSTAATEKRRKSSVIEASSSAGEPIVRGNLRIYPPGPHMSTNGDLATDEEAPPVKKSKTKAAKALSLSTPTTKGTTKANATTTTTAIAAAKKLKSPLSPSLKATKANKAIVGSKAAEAATGKQASAAKGVKGASGKALGSPTSKPISPTGGKKSLALASTKAADGSSEVKAERRTSVSAAKSAPIVAVPAPVAGPPKEVIRYTVGEKTKEELSARLEAERERRENVKFRRLRGRVLTMAGEGGEGGEIAIAPGTSVEDPTASATATETVPASLATPTATATAITTTSLSASINIATVEADSTAP